MAPDRFGNVMHAIRPEEEVPAENVPPEQIHHIGPAVGGRRAGRRHLLKPGHILLFPIRTPRFLIGLGRDRNHRRDSRLALGQAIKVRSNTSTSMMSVFVRHARRSTGGSKAG
jgi:hypothetical protein